MAKPSEKHPDMVKLIDSVTQSVFGRRRHDSIVEDICVSCGGEAKNFKDALSQREFTISGMCQKCQDEVFT